LFLKFGQLEGTFALRLYGTSVLELATRTSLEERRVAVEWQRRDPAAAEWL
jgi:hypothetical protein